MEQLAWVISLIAVGMLGYFFRDLYDRVKRLQFSIKEKIDKPKEEERKSILLDPMDITQKTMEEHAELMRKINPGSRK